MVFAIGQDELDAAPRLGATVKCPRCGRRHHIHNGKSQGPDGTMIRDTLLQYYKCGKNTYIAGIRGKSIMEKFAR